MNVNKLKAKMVLQGVSIEELAAEMGISTATFYRRINDPKNDFNRNEMNTAIVKLKLTKEEAFDIFFSDEVS